MPKISKFNISPYNKRIFHMKRKFKIIFRRYRRCRNGKILDARDYGYEAWPIKIPA
jgi:hypothetical protein